MIGGIISPSPLTYQNPYKIRGFKMQTWLRIFRRSQIAVGKIRDYADR